METKKIIGLIILFLNISGLGFLFYLGGLRLLERLHPSEENVKGIPDEDVKRPKPTEITDDMIPKDDLLKDMDLSDLDNLNLDDFE